MNNKLFILFLCFSFVASSQTSVIFNKSHAGNIASVHSEVDNFGNPPMPNFQYLKQDTISFLNIYDTVYKVNDHCIAISTVNADENNQVPLDTLRYNQYFERYGYSLKSLKTFFHESVIFIGFDEENADDGSEIKEEKSKLFWGGNKPSKGSITVLIGLVFLSFLFYMFVPSLKRK